MCAAIAATIHFFFLANFFWCFCIAFNFYQMIVKRNSRTREFEKWYHMTGWGIPLLFIIGVGLSRSYGQTLQGTEEDPHRGACYIRSGLAVFLSFFLPGLITISANAVLFFFVASEIHGTLSKAPETEQREKTKEFRVLVSIFVTVGLTWVFGFLAAVLAFLPNTTIPADIFEFLFAVTTPLQGFFIFAAYCINRKVRNQWIKFFGKCFPCCKVEEKSTTSSATFSTRGNTTSEGGQTSNYNSERV